MSGPKKKQHYIPRMYLENFLTPNKKFCVYDIQNKKVLLNQSTAQFAHRRYYYDIDPETIKKLLRESLPTDIDESNYDHLIDEQYIENMLSRLEGDAKAVIDGLNNGSVALSDYGVQSKLIIFFHALSQRNPKRRSIAEHINKITRDHIIRSYKLDESNDHLKFYSEEAAKIDQLRSLVSITDVLRLSEIIETNYNWFIGCVHSKYKLVISDNPLEMLTSGLNDICIPLSHDKAIILRVKDPNAPMLSQDSPFDGVITLNDRSIHAYNALQFSQAERFAFGYYETLKFYCDNIGSLLQELMITKSITTGHPSLQ